MVLQLFSYLSVYGVDFSLSSHMKSMNMDTGRAGDSEAISKSEERRRRKAFLRKMRLEQEQQDQDDKKNQEDVLQGMSKIAGVQQQLNEGENCADGLKLESKKDWRKQMRGMQDNVDYTQLFGDDTEIIGQRPGLDIFHIENFLPVAVDETMQSDGKQMNVAQKVRILEKKTVKNVWKFFLRNFPS